MATVFFNSGVANIKKILEKKETNSELQKAILAALNLIRVKFEPIPNIYNNN